ncbi:hypothetical protein D3C72_1778660 [compost metagenome]
MQTQAVVAQTHGNGRVSLNIIELGYDVLFDHSVNFVDFAIPRFLLYHSFCRVRIVQPVGHSRHRVKALARSYRLHGAAVRMAANHDIRDAQCHHCVFDGRRHPARFRAKGRHDVACVTDNEKLPRVLLCHKLGH